MCHFQYAMRFFKDPRHAKMGLMPHAPQHSYSPACASRSLVRRWIMRPLNLAWLYSGQRRLWPDCPIAQAGLELRRPKRLKTHFRMTRLWKCILFNVLTSTPYAPQRVCWWDLGGHWWLHLEVNVIIKSQIRDRSASDGDGVVVVLKVSCIIFARNMLSIDVLTKCPICALRSNALLSFP